MQKKTLREGKVNEINKGDRNVRSLSYRMVMSFPCIRLRRTLGSSGIISFLCSVRSPLVGRPAPLFIIT